MQLAGRLAIIALVLALEGVALSFGIHGMENVPGDAGTAAILDGLHGVQGWLFRFLIAFGGSLAILVFSKRAGFPSPRPGDPAHIRVATPWLVTHGILLTLLVGVSEWAGGERTPSLLILAAVARPLIALGAALALFAAFASGRAWSAAWHDNRATLVLASVMAAAAVIAFDLSHVLWGPAARVTFALVRLLLEPWYPGLHIDPVSMSLATDRFGIIVTDYCSGLEGVGLMLVFCGGWLWCFRAEYRFPRALLIVPVALTIVFLLNSVRIAALLMIGDAGHPRVASAGFHTQAGWIGFNVSAFLIAVISRRIGWLTRIGNPPGATFENPVTPYLLPLAVLLAIGMTTQALSGGFDSLYALRVAGGLYVLWRYRSVYQQLDWRFSARAFAAGTVVLVVWIMTARALTASQPLPPVLAQMSATGRDGWIAARIVGAVVTAPLAEELAYRGFLMRRFVDRHFEDVAWRDVRWPALVASAVAFGIVHGSLWLPAILAGLIYGGLTVRTGRFGEAVAAHTVTNAGLAVYVLAFDQWQLW